MEGRFCFNSFCITVFVMITFRAEGSQAAKVGDQVQDMAAIEMQRIDDSESEGESISHCGICVVSGLGAEISIKIPECVVWMKRRVRRNRMIDIRIDLCWWPRT